jgi:type VI secretion system protein VasG
MLQIRREVVYTRLDPLPFRALQGAFELARARDNAYVELAHWLNQIVMLPDSDLHRIAAAFDIDLARLTEELNRALERIRKGSTDLPDFSEHVDRAIERGWIVASLAFGAGRIRTGHLILGILDDSDLTRVLLALSELFRRLEPERLARQLATIVKGSPEGEAGTKAVAPTGTGAAGALPSNPPGNAEALLRFTHDLTEQARAGKIDPVVGRDEEIRQVVDVLLRRRQNNPILVGEAGVGKTAIVEGLAVRLVAGDVPPSLKDVSLKALDVGLLQAGASMRGELEERLKLVVGEIRDSPTPVILFIDEAHTLIGAGGAAGTGDAANLLKPALARGTLRTIAATTWAEYKKFIEPDAALTRRFEAVRIEQPTFDQALGMMRGIAPALESHHGVRLLDDALHAAVGLSQRYLPTRQLPDKAVSVLDTSCARVAASQAAVPPELERCRQRIAALRAEHALLEREASLGREVGSRVRDLAAALEQEQARAAELESRWASERDLIQRILGQSNEALAATAPGEASERVAALKELNAELNGLQGERPMVLAEVDAEAVASVIAGWTGIPVGRMVKNEIDAVLGLADTLKRRIAGQDHALEMIARRIQTSRAGLENPQKPIGVFLLCGPSGVGKTETALALADALHGGEQNIVSINMSEFQEAHTVSTLKGAPPGYVGYGQGGRLTEAVRRQPYSLVLLDEIEKAHPDVHEIFFQIFDKGLVEDSEGRRIEFRNTLILLTSNIGSDLITGRCTDQETMPDPEELTEMLYPRLLKVFPAALLGRLAVIPYYPLTEDALTRIIRLQLDRVRQRIEERHKVQVRLDEQVLDLVRQRCTAVDSGGRMVDAILSNTVLPEVSRGILERLKDGRSFHQVRIGAAGRGFAYSFA